MSDQLILRARGKHNLADAAGRDDYVVLFQGEWVGSIQIKILANGQEPIWCWGICCELRDHQIDAGRLRLSGITTSREQAMIEFRTVWETVTPDLAAERRRRREKLAREAWPAYRVAHNFEFMAGTASTGEILAWIDAGRPRMLTDDGTRSDA